MTFRPINLAVLVCVMACLALAQNPALTTRDADGKVQVRRQSKGAFLGVYLGNAKGSDGALVGKVIDGSPAAVAGIEANDVLIAIADQPVKTAAQVYQWLSAAQPRESVAIRILRSSETRVLSVLLGERAAATDDPCQRLFSESNALFTESERYKKLSAEAARKGDQKQADELNKHADALFQQAESTRLFVETAIAEGRAGTVGRTDSCLPSMLMAEPLSLGITLGTLTPQLAAVFGAPPSAALISDVRANSIARLAGIKAGDCLIQINGKNVQNSYDLKLVTESLVTGDTLNFSLVRNGKPLTLRALYQ